jgi:hypothetical protein
MQHAGWYHVGMGFRLDLLWASCSIGTLWAMNGLTESVMAMQLTCPLVAHCMCTTTCQLARTAWHA